MIISSRKKRTGVVTMLIKDMEGKTIISGNFRSVKNAVEAAHKRGLSLVHADFSGADLRETDFSGSNLEFANFTGADCTGADFTGADISCTYFNQATLIGCKFNSVAKPWGTGCYENWFLDANLEHASFEESHLDNPHFNGANLTSASFRNSQLHGPNFLGAVLQNTNFFGCKLESPGFDPTNSQNALHLLVVSIPYSWDIEDEFHYFKTYYDVVVASATRCAEGEVHVSFLGGGHLYKSNYKALCKSFTSLAKTWWHLHQ